MIHNWIHSLSTFKLIASINLLPGTQQSLYKDEEEEKTILQSTSILPWYTTNHSIYVEQAEILILDLPNMDCNWNRKLPLSISFSRILLEQKVIPADQNRPETESEE